MPLSITRKPWDTSQYTKENAWTFIMNNVDPNFTRAQFEEAILTAGVTFKTDQDVSHGAREFMEGLQNDQEAGEGFLAGPEQPPAVPGAQPAPGRVHPDADKMWGNQVESRYGITEGELDVLVSKGYLEQKYDDEFQVYYKATDVLEFKSKVSNNLPGGMQEMLDLVLTMNTVSEHQSEPENVLLMRFP